CLAFGEWHAVVIDHDQRAIALHDRARRREIKRDDRDVLKVDVLPHIEFGPIREREDADRLALVFARIVEPPEFGPLVLRIPTVIGGAEGEDAFLGAALLFVAPRAAEGCVEAVFVERLFEALSLPEIGVQRRAVLERIDAARFGVWILVYDQLEA